MNEGIIVINSKQWQVSIATTSWEISQGLGGLESIPPMTGMYFHVCCPARILSVTTYPMLFPIDIAFIHENTIVDIARNALPDQIINSNQPACSFLEVNANELLGIVVG